MEDRYLTNDNADKNLAVIRYIHEHLKADKEEDLEEGDDERELTIENIAKYPGLNGFEVLINKGVKIILGRQKSQEKIEEIDELLKGVNPYLQNPSNWLMWLSIGDRRAREIAATHIKSLAYRMGVVSKCTNAGIDSLTAGALAVLLNVDDSGPVIDSSEAIEENRRRCKEHKSPYSYFKAGEFLGCVIGNSDAEYCIDKALDLLYDEKIEEAREYLEKAHLSTINENELSPLNKKSIGLYISSIDKIGKIMKDICGKKAPEVDFSSLMNTLWI